ncbi:related to 2-dehydropantoate 2-reductase family protein [Fusarium torulosum]|uniref:2-dehydropantoate 2-reductase n=1 Tax=Fusarium torulosum TaxID=33205 RepID=A0AAE8M3C3_9HYPO|nr:related to 2-dehydropantoate 2-reductase family protein [Fusarium torulosum]
MENVRVLLVGCGGIGCIAALNLESGGRAQVTAVLRSSYDIVKERGFTINSVDHGQVRGFRPTEILTSVPDVSQPGISPFDYIICSTKNTPDVSSPVADLIRSAVTPGHSTILLLQNGLNIEDPLYEAFPDNVILSGISMCGSSEPESGTIEHNVHDELLIGPFRDTGDAADRAKDFVARYSASGRCTCRFDSNVAFSRWKKLLYNAVYNPVAALTKLDTGDIQLCPGFVDEVVRPAMKEIQVAAGAYGQELTDEMIEATIITEPIEDHVSPSMLIDVRKEQYIEFENLLGEPLKAAKAKQVATPILQNHYSLAKSYQWKLKSKRGT